MDNIQKKIQETAKKLLAEKKVDVVIGYKAGSNSLRVTPYFVRNPNDAQKIIWNQYCTHNLSNYLPGLKEEKVAIVAKGCDSRSIVEILKNEQAKRERIYIIGVVCHGIISEKKVIAQKKDKAMTEKIEFDISLLEPRCTQCICHTPPLADTLIGEPFVEGAPPETPPHIEKFLKLSPKERLDYWKKTFERCIKCNACKEVCPNCFCEKCVLTDHPEWIDKPRKKEQLWLYQLIRVFHNAGRCTECGQCVRACPMEIPIGLLIKPMLIETKNLFGYESGLSLEEKDPLVTYQLENDEGLIK
ncbi:MAG: 4Fe-4S binding protein [Candidatus Altiarchaeota archaeon]